MREMIWRFEITARAEQDISQLDAFVARRIKEKLTWFAENFEVTVHFPLSGEQGGTFKLRVGDWRIFYIVDNPARVAYIMAVEHRSKAYKKHR